MAEVVLRGVSKSFGATRATDDVSLVVPDGAFVVLLGPTGAGKTTLLRLIAGLEAPDAGAILIGGQETAGLSPAHRNVAMVFQQYSLYPHLSVRDNLAFPLRSPMLRWPEDRIAKKVAEMAEVLHIAHKLDNRATQLSGGEMQRVSIGRALVREPTIHLMDEPLLSLDAKLHCELRIELKRIQRELGATILYVTHDQLEAMTLADRIGVLAEGRLVQIDAPRDVYERPASVYAAQRLGSPPINLLSPGSLGLGEGPAGTRTLGVRPEDVTLNGSGVPASVLTMEHLGVESIALLQVEGAGGAPQQVHALLGSQRGIAEGATVRAAVRPGAVLYFDGEGRRLAAGGEATR